jgi:hypothetical protein
MDLTLIFADGSVSGDGFDDVGRFLIKGRYDADSRECYWTKTYPGSHDVFYRGFRDGNGIWGRWEIAVHDHGGFHIWPRGLSEGEETAESTARAKPVEAVGADMPLAGVGKA